MVSDAGACEATLPDLTMIRVSTANGNDSSPSAVSPELCADDERAKSMLVLFVPPCRRSLPAPEPTGRVMLLASGRSRVPPPVAE